MVRVTRKPEGTGYSAWLARYLERKLPEALERGVVFGSYLFSPMQVRVLPLTFQPLSSITASHPNEAQANPKGGMTVDRGENKYTSP